jgi:protein-arginine kinase activator protein McsA
MKNHFENYRLEELGCLNCRKVQEMKVFTNVENDNQYETAVCPECEKLESLEAENSER